LGKAGVLTCSTLRRFRIYTRNGCPPFIVAVGFAGSVASLAPVGIGITAGVLIGSAFGIGVFVWRSRRLVHLPVDDIAPWIAEPGERVLLCCPCNAVLSKRANELAGRFYGQDSVAWEHYESWRDKNGLILACLQNPAGEVLGYFDFLPLRKRSTELLVCGQITEANLTRRDILSPGRDKRCTRLYLAGIAVRDPQRHAGRSNASIMTWGLMKFLQHYYPPNKDARLLTIAATGPGEALLKKFHFELAVPGFSRKDRHNLYARAYSQPFLTDALNRLPDWSAICRLSWLDVNKKARARL
jgi:hypothetical protein